MKVKCACRDPKCQIELTLDTHSGMLIIDRNTDDHSSHIGMYLDANGAVDAARGFKAFLIAQAEKVEC